EPEPQPPGELPEMAALAPPAPEPPVPAERRTRPAGAPSVRVSFLVYSSAPERRTVALTIDDGGLVTLHEGESASGVSVGRILPDGVELTWQGQAFTVPARE
ncbi:MAG TPA: general secretion pathway protein GspB, partial [Candidatus Limnocylindria bacterium]|nr:general secretion pathway protein GspB [Candidatus Limnocylindria bacterium]